MTGWDNIPNEILINITTCVGTKATESEWMFVNKQSLFLYQSTVLKEIELSLDFSDKLFNSIVNSTFQMGHWVKTIRFTLFEAPEKTDACGQDLLELLMIRCPYVEKVEFPFQHINSTAWTYFNSILSKNNENTWKLKYLPEEYNTLSHAQHYFQAAYHMRHSLKELNLTKDMIAKNDLHYLQEFQNLKSLRVGSYVLDSVDDYLSLLKYLPHLIELDMDIYLTTPSNQPVKPYPNIKKLTLRNFTPVHDHELHVIMKTFPGLKTFFLPATNESDFWFPSLASMESLFKYMYTIPKFEIYNARSLTGEYGLLSSYCAAQPVPDPNQHHLYIGFLETCTLYLYGALFAAEITKIKSTCKVEIIYGMWNEPAEEISRSVQTLSHIDSRIDEINIDLSHRNDYPVQDYLNTIVCNSSKYVRRINISGGLLDNYPIHLITNQHVVSRLEFKDSTIKESALPLMSAAFPNLQKLSFQACRFRNREANDITVSMPYTTVDTVLFTGPFIDYSSFKPSSIILMSIESIDQNKFKYVMVFVQDKSELELNSSQFEALKMSPRSDVMTTLKIRFKTVQNFTLQVNSTIKPYSLQLSLS